MVSSADPVNPKRRELEILRVLFDRHLADRAVALAESRWPGSGGIVRLAYDWGSLRPEQRRERVSSISPEDLARLRALTALHPDLEAAVDDLDRRGVLPSLEQAVIAGAASMAGDAHDVHPTRDDASPITDVDAPAATADEPAATVDAEPGEVVGESWPDSSSEPAEYVVDAAIEDPDEPAQLDEPPVTPPENLTVEMPALDLGLPTTGEFLAGEERRRQQALEQTEATMQRVHARLDQSANRAWSRASSSLPSPRIAGTPPSSELALPPATPPAPPPAPTHGPSTGNLIEAPARIIDALESAAVLQLASRSEAPSDDELVAIANELGLGLREFTLEPGQTRTMFGGLRRIGAQIKPEAGPLPSALARKNLVVVYGRMQPSLIERISAGFADIPGTRATVKVHPEARLIVVPPR